MKPAPVRIALVGAGVIGTHHLRNLREMEDVEVAGIVESDHRRAGRLEAQGARVLRNLDGLLAARPDAAVVAVPTSIHAEVAIPLLEAGIACLVEKPLAGTVADAQAIVDAAASSGALLAVGHVERPNPPGPKHAGLIDRREIGDVRMFAAVRTGPMPSRVGDVGVIFDLVSHDLDIVRWLVGADPESISADVIGWTEKPRREAALHLVARFPSGLLATLDASWLHPTKTRHLHCLGTEGLISVDYLQQEVTFARNDYEYRDWGPLLGLTAVSPGEQIRYRLQRTEPLRAELEAFVSALRGEPDAVVTGADGLAIVKILAGLLDDVGAPQPAAGEPGA